MFSFLTAWGNHVRKHVLLFLTSFVKCSLKKNRSGFFRKYFFVKREIHFAKEIVFVWNVVNIDWDYFQIIVHKVCVILNLKLSIY